MSERIIILDETNGKTEVGRRLKFMCMLNNISYTINKQQLQKELSKRIRKKK